MMTDGQGAVQVTRAVATGSRGEAVDRRPIITRDTELGGVHLTEDDQLIVLLCTANRDPDYFDSPATFDISRNPNRHLSFGSGPHRCLGSHLGRIELTVALEELHRRIPDYQLVESDPPVFHSTQVRGCHRMPITFTPEK